MELRDRDLVLRRFRPDDVPAIAAACADPETARFTIHIPSPYTEEHARAYLELCEQGWERNERRPFAIAHAHTGELLGAIDVRLGEVGSIGYWVAPWARGRGV